jgi:hypothetical protein
MLEKYVVFSKNIIYENEDNNRKELFPFDAGSLSF